MENPISKEQLEEVARRPIPKGGSTTEHEASVETALVSIACDLRRIADSVAETNAKLGMICRELDAIARK